MIAILFFLIAVQDAIQVENKLKPIIFFHGLGGVQVEAKLNRKAPLYPHCTKVKDWSLIWFSLFEYGFDTDCFVDNIRLIYDPANRSMVNQEGVDIRTAGVWGDVDSISYLDPYLQYLSRYFYPIINVMKSSFNYTNMDTMFALHYDFRRLGDVREMNKYFSSVTSFIEKLFTQKKQSVILVSHSMGGPIVANLLKDKTQAWKDMYIDSWYSINGALAGSVQTTISALVGSRLGIPLLISPPKKFIPFLVSMTSLYYLMASPRVFPKNQTVITINNTDYSVEQARGFIAWHRIPEMANVLPYIPDPFVETPPNVAMECVYSTGFPTNTRVIFTERSIEKKYTLVSGDGDGSVNIESLSSCEKWRKTSTRPFHSTVFPGFSHHGILSQKLFLQHLQNFVASRNRISSFNREIKLD